MSTRVLTFEQYIRATPEQVCRAFTNASALREWLCDIATVDPRPGGRMYLAWNSGYYASGEYTSVEAGQEVDFVWYGRDDPARSQVRVTCQIQEGGVRVILEHALPEDDQEWTRTVQEIEKGWRDSLENLASVLETGEDERFTRRPMLGVNLNDFTPAQAAELGVPATSGVRIESVVQGMGAAAAGLLPNDVIVGLAGREVHSFNDLAAALAGHRANERIPVEIYRGPQKLTLQLTLSSRPLPEIPASLKGLATYLRQIQARFIDELNALFQNVSEADAACKPAQEWNIKEILAHLIHSERGFQAFVVEMAESQERWADDFGSNLDAAVRATVDAYPGASELVDELKRAYHETASLIAYLPPELQERKGAFWRLTYTVTELPAHFNTHLEQMKQMLKTAHQG